MRPDGGFRRSIIRVLCAAWQRETDPSVQLQGPVPVRAQGSPQKHDGRVKPPERARRPAPMRPPAGIARPRDTANAEMHRQSARAVMQAHHQGTL